MNTPEQRRAPRKRPDYAVTVTDVITGQPLGHVGNLSSNGMLLISHHAPRSEAIYQVNLPLPAHDGSMPAIEVGIQEQWHEPAATPGQIWSGYRIIAIGTSDAAHLERWLLHA
ncbi:PilZ domain-containing protein [Dyella monticola]|uniref:PilZ domain-containing protein n=1 Tax=Dyella monticola TaxID=1927958 RepID=A0A370X3P6_9GAMM|nr:PilZ domain-containing protein [Dyella monticola]RDS82917.1 PilZ domain-containing protein [Dyella monticola]